MEIDKGFVRDQILTIPGMRQAMAEQNYDEVFRLCQSTKKKMQLAQALFKSNVKFLPYMTEIPESLFRGCEDMMSVIIPGNIKKIGDLAFMGSGLQVVTLEEGIEEIGRGAFAQTPLKEIHLPKSIKKLGELICGKANVFCFLTQEELDRITENNDITTKNLTNEETGDSLNH